MILLLKKPPNPSLDFWHIKSKKIASSSKPMLLHSRKYCMFSTLQSVHTNNFINYDFIDNLKAQSAYIVNHSATYLLFPKIPS